jgi:8-oxo-dGTP pyrophosphatase MutT (NUDIX family)
MVIERRAARALLIAGRSVLLIKGCDPARPEAGTWWLTPGGGIEADEAIEDAMVREILEETGLQITPERVGNVVATRVGKFSFDNESYVQTETFFAIAVERFDPHAEGWDSIEQRALLEHRWWTIEELRATTERLYPMEMAAVVQAVLDGSIEQPMKLGGN